MEIRIDRVNDRVHLRAHNEDGNEVHIDGSPTVGGEGAGFRPMQLLLAALASCASMDVIPILEKQRQRLDDIHITVTGERVDGTPSPFRSIHVHYDLAGEIDEEKAKHAIELGLYKYCSVGETLSKSVELTYSVTVTRSGS